jgi:16S rRNA (guanine527-N7)-methyltransferase
MKAGDVLAQGLIELDLSFPAETSARLMQYVALLEKWNKVYSLTAVRGDIRIVTHHVLDSLAVLPYLGGRRTVDVGSGAGLPGIPLALARPEMRVILLDANQKKAAFLRQAVIDLKLDNAEVVCERVERWRTAARFDVVISRAFSDFKTFVQLAARLCAPQGVLAAMKGGYAESDMGGLPSAVRLKKAVRLTVPGLNATRHLVLLQPVAQA